MFINIAKESNQHLNMFFFFWLALVSIVFIEPAPFDFLFLIALGLVIWDNYRQGKTIRHLMNHIDKELLVFICINLVGLVVADSLAVGLKYFLITSYLILLVPVIRYYLHNGGNFKIILRGYYVAALLAATLGLFSFYTGSKSMFMYDEYRILGTFKDPNVFGPFFIPVIVSLFEQIRQKGLKGVSFPLIELLLSTVFMTALVFSFSRAAWLSLVASILVYYIMVFRSLNFKVIINYLIILICTGTIIIISLIGTGRGDFFVQRLGFQPYDQDRFSKQAESVGLNLEVAYQKGKLRIDRQEDDADQTRSPKGNLKDKQDQGTKPRILFFYGGDLAKVFFGLKTHIAVFVRNLVGIGPGQFEISYKYAAHSFPVRTFVENGLIGFGVLVVFILKSLVRSFKNLKKSSCGGESSFHTAIFPILIALLINGLFVDTIHWRHFWIFFALVGVRARNVDRGLTGYVD